MYKVIDLLKRRPGMEVAVFQQYLLKQHGPLLQGAPELMRYVQSLALPQGYAKGELLFDAIAEWSTGSPPRPRITHSGGPPPAAPPPRTKPTFSISRARW